jgi:hypothetical protein
MEWCFLTSLLWLQFQEYRLILLIRLHLRALHCAL